MTENQIVAIKKEPGKAPEVIQIENSLRAFQEAVGGYVKAVTTPVGVVLCDEVSRLKGKPPCMTFHGVDFVGTCLLVGAKGDEFTDADNQLVRAVEASWAREILG